MQRGAGCRGAAEDFIMAKRLADESIDSGSGAIPIRRANQSYKQMTVAMNFLDEIIRRKREQIQRAKDAVPLSELTERARAVRQDAKPFALRAAISSQESELAVIAEFKRASPSQGDIRQDADAAEITRTFEQNGAAAISVLTEEDYFRGSLED